MKLQHSLFLLSLFITSFSIGQDITARTKYFNLSAKELAIQGYDPVAYFVQGKAVKGKKEQVVTHQGVVYQFSSLANKNLFLQSPESYEPQYGGWCAYAMGAKGEKVSIDPETFKIVNNKLYLFYNRFFNNTLSDWNKNETALKLKADESWKKIIH